MKEVGRVDVQMLALLRFRVNVLSTRRIGGRPRLSSDIIVCSSSNTQCIRVLLALNALASAFNGR